MKFTERSIKGFEKVMKDECRKLDVEPMYRIEFDEDDSIKCIDIYIDGFIYEVFNNYYVSLGSNIRTYLDKYDNWDMYTADIIRFTL